MDQLSYGKQHNKRFDKTIRFMQKHVSAPCKILDLGTPNPMSKKMINLGHQVLNTKGEDLDLDYQVVEDESIELVTAFEVFEHLVAPFNVLRAIKAPRLLASVPLDLWFAKAYWNEKEEWDCHYHEFEARQFDMLLKKAGWTIQDTEKWTNPSYKLGFRSVLRYFTPRHYIVYCTRS